MANVYWTVAPEWKRETVFIIGGGTSVATQNVEGLKGRRVIVVNSSYEAAPFADMLFFGDVRWWNVHRDKLSRAGFAGRIVTCSHAAAGANLLRLKRVEPPPGFAVQPDSVASQRTSLQGAMNLAAHLGAARIVLLGADMRRADNGATHHHSGHQWPNKPGNITWDIQMSELRLIVQPLKDRGIEVINTSPITRLEWWTRRSLDEVLSNRFVSCAA